MKLFAEIPSPVKKGNVMKSRYTLILQAYGTIRNKVMTSSILNQDTGLVLVDVNQTTLSEW